MRPRAPTFTFTFYWRLLVWGDAQDAGLKGSVAEAFLADERHGSAAGGVAEIDVSVPTRPITR